MAHIYCNSLVKINHYLWNNRQRCGDFVLTLALIGLNPIVLCVKDGPKYLSFSW